MISTKQPSAWNIARWEPAPTTSRRWPRSPACCATLRSSPSCAARTTPRASTPSSPNPPPTRSPPRRLEGLPTPHHDPSCPGATRASFWRPPKRIAGSGPAMMTVDGERRSTHSPRLAGRGPPRTNSRLLARGGKHPGWALARRPGKSFTMSISSSYRSTCSTF